MAKRWKKTRCSPAKPMLQSIVPQHQSFTTQNHPRLCCTTATATATTTAATATSSDIQRIWCLTTTEKVHWIDRFYYYWFTFWNLQRSSTNRLLSTITLRPWFISNWVRKKNNSSCFKREGPSSFLDRNRGESIPMISVWCVFLLIHDTYITQAPSLHRQFNHSMNWRYPGQSMQGVLIKKSHKHEPNVVICRYTPWN